MLGRHHHGGEVHLHTAELFRDHDGRQPELRALIQDAARHAGLVMLDLLQVRLHFLGIEFIHRAADGEMFFAQVLGGENIGGRTILDQEGAARCNWNCGCCRHDDYAPAATSLCLSNPLNVPPLAASSASSGAGDQRSSPWRARNSSMRASTVLRPTVSAYSMGPP